MRFLAVAIALAFSTGALHALEESDLIVLGKHEVHPTRILARYKADVEESARAATLASVGLEVRRQYRLAPRLVALDVPEGEVSAAAVPDLRAQMLLGRIEALRNSGQFEYVEPDYIVRPTLQPTDSRFQDGTLWGLRNTGAQGGVIGADIDAVRAWDITTGSTNVIVAVIDTGVRYTHQDLAAQMWRNPGESGGGRETNGIDDDGDGYIDNVFGINAALNNGNPIDVHDHGTHVAGTIGAQANGGGPHVGVAWNVQIMALKFLNPFGATSDAIECVDFAVTKGVRISNNSWGGGPFSTALRDAIAAARDAGHLFLAAAGNDASNNDQFPHYPSNYDLDNIISVAALDRADRLANFSNFGATSVDLGGPGVAIFSSTSGSDSTYSSFQGTSMATPHVSGVAALLLAHYPQATYQELRERLLLTVVPVAALAGKSTTGGRVNAFNALSVLPDGVLELTVTPPSGSVLLGGSTTPMFVRVTDLFGITNATVTGTIAGGGSLTFSNNGMLPDLVMNDAVYSANLNVPTGVTNLTITLVATATNKVGVTNVIDYFVIPPPPNDDFANALKVPTPGGLVLANNQFAGIEIGEPIHAGVPSAASSLWWNWSPAASGPVLLDTAGSSFDTVLAVYTGTNVAALTEIASVDDVGSRLQGYLSFNATAATTYRIVVAGYDTNEVGTIRLRVEPGGSPDTNAPAVAITDPLSGSTVFTNQITLSGIASDPSPNASGVSEVSIRVNNTLPPKIATGTTNWSTFVLLNQGTNLVEAVAFDFAGNQSVIASAMITFTPPLPANDHFVNATPLTNSSGVATANTTQATKEFGEPNHAANAGGKSVWWTFTPPSSGTLFLSTTNSDFDTLLGLYTGSHVASLTTVASNDDADPEVLTSELTQAVTGGQVYRIAVDGYAGASGNLELTYEFTPTTVFSLSVSNTTGGTTAPASGLFASNAMVSITATASNNYQFDGWEGSVTSPDNPLNVIITNDLNLTARFVEQAFADGFESGGFNTQNLAWNIAGGPGNVPWLVQGNEVAFGQFAARSGVIGHNQSSSLSLVANVVGGTAFFDFKVSSEEGWDFLEFYIDGILQQRWSGETGWARHTFNLAGGARTLQWRYIKDATVSAGMDAAFIDNLSLPTVPNSLTLIPTGIGSFQIQAQGQPGTITQALIHASTNLATWSNIGTVPLTNGIGQFTDPDVGSHSQRFYRGQLP